MQSTCIYVDNIHTMAEPFVQAIFVMIETMKFYFKCRHNLLPIYEIPLLHINELHHHGTRAGLEIGHPLLKHEYIYATCKMKHLYVYLTKVDLYTLYPDRQNK